MKDTMLKIANAIKKVFGYGIMLSLFLGGLTFFAFVVALIVGGDTAVMICDVVYNKFIPVLIYATNVFVAMGLVAMYFAGEKALTPESGASKYGKK